MSGPHKMTSSEDINSESSEMNIKEEMSSRDEFIPDSFLTEMSFVYYETEIEIKHEEMDYNNYNPTPDLDSETGYDLDFETISKTRADFSLSAIRIQSSRDESRDEFIPEIRLSEAPLFIHDTEIEIKYEDVDYNNYNSTPALDSVPVYDLDYETISKTRAELSTTAIHIQSDVDEGIVKMECSEEQEEMDSDSYEELDYNSSTPRLDSVPVYDLDFETISKTRAELSSTAIHIQSDVDEGIVKMECLQKEEAKPDSGSEPGFELSGSDPDYCPISPSTHVTRNLHRQSLQNNDALHGSIISEAKKRIDQFKCSDCGKSLTTKAILTVHMRTHTGERPYTCEVCAKSYLTKHSLTIHMTIHTGERPYQCNRCEISFAMKSNLTTHMRIHTGEKPHECSMCEMSFIQSGDLTRHKRIHTGEKPYKCNECEKSFSRKSNLTTHMRLHTGEKPYKCDVCHRCFTKSGTLNRHTRVHTGERRYKCNECEKSFSQKTTLTSHMRNHTTE